ncbi:MAG: DUF983 domain-containing protein [Gemmatimonadaceae bacterium]
MSLYLNVNGSSWSVERRHEMAQLMTARQQRERKLYLFFQAADGELRRGEIAENFPLSPSSKLLESAWRNAEVLRPGSPGEMQSRGGMVVPRMRDVITLFWRAVRLRCPNCSGKPVLRTWFKLLDQCPVCSIRLERGEDEDYYLGGMFFNIILAEAVFVVGFLAFIAAMWPNVPWDGMEYILAAAMIGAPILLYPVSRLLWLALDLLLRPPDATEMAWHSASERKPD